MKKELFFLFALALFLPLLFDNCKKEDPFIPPVPPTPAFDTAAYLKKLKLDEIEKIFLPGAFQNGQMNAQKNGKDWNGSTAASPWINHDHFFVEASTFDEKGILTENIFFAKIPKATGRYRFNRNLNDLDGFVFPSYWRGHEDAGLAHLYHDTDYKATDFLEVTMLDTVNRIIAGRFDVHLTDSLFDAYPVYLYLENGRFETKY